ncbi:nicotinamide-nucleotide amidohydrolase PncC [Rubritalea halochordaticola]|uniref:CinA-like protein n=2 Tax=Rubritalea halochordaticola TaxID=714537 RepID=A0ABP9UXF8_9BACT
MGMHIEVVNTGTELLLGTTLNSHGAWIGQRLMEQGLRVARQTTVPDGEAVKQALAEAIERSDVLIVTGGLGPTSDDLTREATAEAMGIELIEDEHALRVIERFFANRGRPMAEGNRKQALTPCGAEVLPNPNGTAPGVYVPPRLGKGSPCAVFLLPGPPNELYPMYQAEVPHRLAALANLDADSGMHEMKFTGIGESDFHDGVDQKLHQVAGLEIGYCARPGELDLRLIGSPEAREKGRAIVLAEYADECISEGGTSLEETVVQLLTDQGLKLALAESCTGGLVASRVTDVPGASVVLTHGFVTYANEAKRDVLGVPQGFLEDYGAVSEEVARAMAEGALNVSGADVAAAVTGIAGPGGGSEEKPVGTVWISVARKGSKTIAYKAFKPWGRDVFKMVVSQLVLDSVRRVAMNLPLA